MLIVSKGPKEVVFFVVLGIGVGVAIVLDLSLLQLVGVAGRRADGLGKALHAHGLLDVVLGDVRIDGTGGHAAVRQILREAGGAGQGLQMRDVFHDRDCSAVESCLFPQMCIPALTQTGQPCSVVNTLACSCISCSKMLLMCAGKPGDCCLIRYCFKP